MLNTKFMWYNIFEKCRKENLMKRGKLLEEFKNVWDYASKSLSYNSDNYNAYYSRAANI